VNRPQQKKGKSICGGGSRLKPLAKHQAHYIYNLAPFKKAPGGLPGAFKLHFSQHFGENADLYYY